MSFSPVPERSSSRWWRAIKRSGRYIGWAAVGCLGIGLLLTALSVGAIFLILLSKFSLTHSILTLSVVLLFTILYVGAIGAIDARGLATWDNVRYPWSSSNGFDENDFNGS